MKNAWRLSVQHTGRKQPDFLISDSQNRKLSLSSEQTLLRYIATQQQARHELEFDRLDKNAVEAASKCFLDRVTERPTRLDTQNLRTVLSDEIISLTLGSTLNQHQLILTTLEHLLNQVPAELKEWVGKQGPTVFETGVIVLSNGIYWQAKQFVENDGTVGYRYDVWKTAKKNRKKRDLVSYFLACLVRPGTVCIC